jgi:putative membrane protein
MSALAQSILNEWSPPVTINVAIFLAAFIYLRGWLSLRRSSPELVSLGRLAAFLAGMFSLWIAIGSPLSAFDEASLTVHMVQHIFLMLVVPPLVLFGAPSLLLLHGLPLWFVRSTLGPFLRWPPVQSLGKLLTNPVVCWILASVALLAWHVPSAFELALRSDSWHEVEHFCFLSTSILFWWPVVQPFPSEARWPRWSTPLYLFFGMFPGSALGAFLAHQGALSVRHHPAGRSDFCRLTYVGLRAVRPPPPRRFHHLPTTLSSPRLTVVISALGTTANFAPLAGLSLLWSAWGTLLCTPGSALIRVQYAVPSWFSSFACRASGPQCQCFSGLQ